MPFIKMKVGTAMERTELIITSLSEYIEKVTILPETVYYSGTSNMFHIYRGQANINWDLNPSAYRFDRFQHEKNFIYEMETIAPYAFSGMSRIEKLIKMQHFGLPTRFLDFTRNSLVALYFACCSEHNEDGAVYEIHAFPMLRQDATPISIVMKYLFELGSTAVDPDEFLNDLNETEYPSKLFNDFKSRQGLSETLSKPYGIYPKLSNERIRNQDGVFVMAGMEITETRNIWTFQPKQYPTVQSIFEESRRIVIPYNSKNQIIQSLDKIGINERYLFPGLDADARWAVRRVEAQQFLHGAVYYYK